MHVYVGEDSKLAQACISNKVTSQDDSRILEGQHPTSNTGSRKKKKNTVSRTIGLRILKIFL